MAHNLEPMDIDTIDNDFDNKENTFHHGNFVSKTPCTEKGYEELDVSELNMKLRYSVTPASSPMSKSVTLNNNTESKNYDRGDNSCFNTTETCKMSRSLNSTVTINDTLKFAKTLPLQPLSTEHCADGVKQVLRPLEMTITPCDGNEGIISPVNYDENFSLPSSSSSLIHTPEATTPSKELSKQDGGSPIMRGLKSVLNIFRTSQGSAENEKSPDIVSSKLDSSSTSEQQQVVASTPVSYQKVHSSKLSPHRESIVFKEDLQKELQWKEDTTIIFSQERVPPHKLFPEIETKLINLNNDSFSKETNDLSNLDNTITSMDISLYYNDCSVGDVTMAENNTATNITAVDSDNEFLDCETTFKEDCKISTIIEGNIANLTKPIDNIRDSHSQGTKVANSTFDVQQNVESCLNTEVKETVIVSSESPKEFKQTVQPSDGITQCLSSNSKDLNVSSINKQIHEEENITSTINTNLKQEAIIITTPNKAELCSIASCEKKYVEHVEDKKPSEKKIDNVQLTETHQNEKIVVNSCSKEIEPKESEKFECTNYDMVHDSDTTIDVLSNIDTLVDEPIINKSGEYFQESTKQNIDALNTSPVDVPLPEIDDFDLLNDSIIATQKETSVTVPVITDIKSDMTTDCESTSSTSEKVLDDNKELSEKTDNNVTVLVSSQIGFNPCTQDVNVEHKIDHIDKITQVTTEENTAYCASLQASHFDKTRKDASGNIQIPNVEEHILGEDVEFEERNKKELEDLKTENNILHEEVTSSKDLINTEILNNVTINTEDEIVVSENNSPYVSLSASYNEPENMINPFATKTKTAVTPPISPPIASKGYNFNFDDIEDPFATKTKIRISPSLDNLNTTIASKKSPEESQPPTDTQDVDIEENNALSNEGNIGETIVVPTDVIFTATNFASLSSTTFDIVNDDDRNTKNLDSLSSATFDIVSSSQSSQIETQDLQFKMDSTIILSVDSLSNTSDRTSTDDSKINVKESLVSSSEHSAYHSVEQSCMVTEIDISLKTLGLDNEQPTVEKNNLGVTTISTEKLVLTDKCDLHTQTETALCIDSEIKQTDTEVSKRKEVMQDEAEVSPTDKRPYPSFASVLINSEINTMNITDSDKLLSDNIKQSSNSKESCDDLNSTSSSKITDDKNNTVREINTEDEDTVEGPFLETDDLTDDVLDKLEMKQDMMQFVEVSRAENNEDPDAGEMFIDAEAFEFLLNQNTANVVSDCGKESLFLKFDPLFAKRTSLSVLAARTKDKPSIPTDSSRTSTSNEVPKAGPSNEATEINNILFEDKLGESLNITTKPTMKVTPAVNAVVPKVQTVSSKPNRQSFTSPAIAVIDRILAISGNNSLLDQDNTPLNNHHQESNQNYSMQIRELLAEKELQLHAMRSESSKLRDTLSVLEAQVEKLAEEGQERLGKINALNKKLEDETKENKNMVAVVEEYEKFIATLLATREQEKKEWEEERKQLIKERDEQIAHLTNMECSFNDLHSKYEKCKQTILGHKMNEDAYKKTIKDFEESLSKMQDNYELLKQHATSKLHQVNQELDKINKSHAAEVLKLKAMIKRKELEITSLEESVAQKTKANNELTAICDELINKVG